MHLSVIFRTSFLLMAEAGHSFIRIRVIRLGVSVSGLYPLHGFFPLFFKLSFCFFPQFLGTLSYQEAQSFVPDMTENIFPQFIDITVS